MIISLFCIFSTKLTKAIAPMFRCPNTHTVAQNQTKRATSRSGLRAKTGAHCSLKTVNGFPPSPELLFVEVQILAPPRSKQNKSQIIVCKAVIRKIDLDSLT